MKIKNIIAGAAALSEWFGENQETVPAKIANQRALVCSGCPHNKPGSWVASWGSYAFRIMGIHDWLRERGCITGHDKQLHICDACDCPMIIKVHCPIEIIEKHMTDETKKSLWENCWIRKP